MCKKKKIIARALTSETNDICIDKHLNDNDVELC